MKSPKSIPKTDDTPHRRHRFLGTSAIWNILQFISMVLNHCMSTSFRWNVLSYLLTSSHNNNRITITTTAALLLVLPATVPTEINEFSIILFLFEINRRKLCWFVSSRVCVCARSRVAMQTYGNNKQSTIIFFFEHKSIVAAIRLLCICHAHNFTNTFTKTMWYQQQSKATAPKRHNRIWFYFIFFVWKFKW